MKLIRISTIWCTSCIVTFKAWNEIKEEYPDFKYEELDYDTDDIKKYNIGTIIPVIVILDENDQEITRIIGEKNKKEIKKVIEEVIK